MKKSFKKTIDALPKQTFTKDLTCFIVFGSSVSNNVMEAKPGDVDVCVVVKNRNADLHAIVDFIFSQFKEPDFRIYFEDEVKSDLQFMDKGVGWFALEYFAHGIVLYGENIFIKKLATVDRARLKESYLNKIFEYIIRIREAYISKNSSNTYRLWHLRKYLIRLLIDILLYRDHIRYGDLAHLSKIDIINLGKKYTILGSKTTVDFNNLESMYGAYREINEHVVAHHSHKHSMVCFPTHLFSS